MAERKERLIRILQLMEKTDEKTPMNSIQILQGLDEYTLGEIDRRAVYRDISMLQYCGYNIVSCKDKRKGWYMQSHAFEDWEIKIMMDAVQQAKCVSIKEANDIKKKLLKLTSNRGRSRFGHLIIPKTGNISNAVSLGNYIEIMLEAMYSKKKIEFQYTEINNDMKSVLRKEGRIYKLNLYTLYWSNNNYYLIGAHDKYNELTYYRLDRVINLRESEERMIAPEEKLGPNPDWYIQEYIEKTVNNFSGKEIKIELEYTPSQGINGIILDFIGKQVAVHHSKDGKCRVKFSKMESETLVGWLVEYSDEVKVVKPDILREKVIRKLEEGLKTYRQNEKIST